MFIPKDSIMMVNVWHPEIYGGDAAHSGFNPARFLDKNGDVTSLALESKEGHVTYGFERRVCVGKHVANNLLFIYMAMVLWACTIGPAKDENGHVILTDVDGCVEDAVVV